MPAVGVREQLRRRLRDFLTWLLARIDHGENAPALPPPPSPSPTPAGPLAQTPTDTIKAWSEYAKDRFDAEADRIVEFRNWSRQLTAAIGLVVAFEVNAVVQIVLKGDSEHGLAWAARVVAIAAFAVAAWRQARALNDALRVGYRGDPLTGPESPAKLGEFILGKDEWETARLIGAYYANAFTEFYELAETLGKQVGTASLEFRRSLRPLFFALGSLVVGFWGPSLVGMLQIRYGEFVGCRSGSAQHAGLAQQPTVHTASSEPALGYADPGAVDHEGRSQRPQPGEPMSNPTDDATPTPTEQPTPPSQVRPL